MTAHAVFQPWLVAQRGSSKDPSFISERIEAAGRRVAFSQEFLALIPRTYAADGDRIVLTTPSLLGLRSGGSIRKAHSLALNRHGLRPVPPVTALWAAEAYTNQPAEEDILVGMDFIRGPDGKEYTFHISNVNEPRRGISNGKLCGPWIGAVYFDPPFEKDLQYDYIAPDQKLAYLQPVQ